MSSLYSDACNKLTIQADVTCKHGEQKITIRFSLALIILQNMMKNPKMAARYRNSKGSVKSACVIWILFRANHSAMNGSLPVIYWLYAKNPMNGKATRPESRKGLIHIRVWSTIDKPNSFHALY